MDTAKEKTNTDLVIDAVISLLTQKNPLLKVKEGEYRSELTQQYELYIFSQVVGFLNPDDKQEFDLLLDKHPYDKQMHNEYLQTHIPNLSDILVDVASSFILIYKNMINEVK